MKHWALFCAVLTAGSSQGSGGETSPADKATNQTRGDIKIVRLVVAAESSGADGLAQLPFYEVSRRVLGYAGIKVVSSTVNSHYDATLIIKAAGNPLHAGYVPAPRPKPQVVDSSYLLYTGATLRGEITLILADSLLFRQPFSGERDPPEAIPYLTKVPCRSPADAPFCAVFNEAFLPALLRMVGTLRGGDPLVTAALKDDAEEVRRAAARLLGEMGDAGTVRRLIDSLRSKSEEICSRACLALEEIGKPAVLPLIEALNDPNNNVRDGAACALGEIGDWRAVEPLIAALKDTDAHVRTTAAISLGNLKAYEAVGPLIEALADEDEFVRAFAAAALSTITGNDFGEDLDKWQRWWQEVYLKE